MHQDSKAFQSQNSTLSTLMKPRFTSRARLSPSCYKDPYSALAHSRAAVSGPIRLIHSIHSRGIGHKIGASTLQKLFMFIRLRFRNFDSPKPLGQRLDIFKLRVLHDINIVPCWVPREGNQLIDSFHNSKTRTIGRSDLESFSFIQSSLGPNEIDRFADFNAKHKRF